MPVQEPINLYEFIQRFSTDEACANIYSNLDGPMVLSAPDAGNQDIITLAIIICINAQTVNTKLL